MLTIYRGMIQPYIAYIPYEIYKPQSQTQGGCGNFHRPLRFFLKIQSRSGMIPSGRS